MANEDYKLKISTLAIKDLTSISNYINNELKNNIACIKFLEEFDIKIKERLLEPLAYPEYMSTKKRNNKYYVINVKNFTVFYVVMKDKMIIKRVLYSKRNFSKFI
ncbi:MAG: type II toxin-antitoxin system RelE/ParE family toxin [Lachnospiraceae bacterium]|jgi:mRNA-degrading endonuclease RelE of RelBE toxin-antitoxin system|nr:type II toxin-antitoxin system RelE/ParE family toxin [Lachnospiraceae bacterium]